MASIVQKNTTHWEIFFNGLPDWVIPMIKVIPKFYTDDIYNDNWNNLDFEYDFNYFWEKVDNINYKLYIQLSGGLTNGEYGPAIPLYVDLSLWIINIQYKNSVQYQTGY